MTDSAAVSVTLKVTWPLASVVAADGAEMCAEHEAVQAKVTALPATGIGPVAFSVTVTVERFTPSAVTIEAEAAAVDAAAEGVAGGGGRAVAWARSAVGATGLALMKNGWDHR